LIQIAAIFGVQVGLTNQFPLMEMQLDAHVYATRVSTQYI
jgi:hypothetical protein